MKELFILRHGEIAAKNRYLGATDMELSDKGIEQIKALAQRITHFNFEHIFCSPLKRCVQTSSWLSLTGEIQMDERLREVNFGSWEGKSFEVIANRYPDEVSRWCNDESFVFPGGESIKDFRNRVIAFCSQLEMLPGKRILIITHGGVIRHMICHLLKIPFSNYLVFQIDYGHFTTLKLFSDGGVLTSLNSGTL